MNVFNSWHHLCIVTFPKSWNRTTKSHTPYVKQIVNCLLDIFASVPTSRDRCNTPAILKLSCEQLILEAAAGAENKVFKQETNSRVSGINTW